MDDHQPSAAETFDNIRAGSQNLLLNLHSRLGAIKDCFDRGEFQGALQEINTLSQLTQPIAMAEQVLGFMGKGKIVPGENIVEGMTLLHIGKITEITAHDDCERVATLENGSFVALQDRCDFVVADEPDVK
jgi:hypothetical protein